MSAKHMGEFYPPPDRAVTMQPEELGASLLAHLVDLEKRGEDNRLHLGNYFGASQLTEYSGSLAPREVKRAITEAWIWLEREGLIAPRVEHGRDWVYVTKRGRSLLTDHNWDAFRRGELLGRAVLYPALAQKALPPFMRGEYEAAVFLAFKEVEVAVRQAAALPDGRIGVALMREAFHPDGGPLSNRQAEKGERESVAALFAGAIGFFKNPVSHRDVDWTDAQEAAEAILFANHLLRIIVAHQPPAQ